jgi:hypothetical protein
VATAGHTARRRVQRQVGVLLAVHRLVPQRVVPATTRMACISLNDIAICRSALGEIDLHEFIRK